MRKNFMFLIVFCFFLNVVYPTMASAAVTTYINSTFNVSFSGESELSGWTQHKRNENDIIECLKSSSSFLSTSKHLHMKSENSCYIYRSVTGLTEGQLLTFSFKLKIESGSASVTFDFWDVEGGHAGTRKSETYCDVSDEWIDYEFDILVPENAAKVNVLVYVNEGDVYYDDVVMSDMYDETKLFVRSGGLDLNQLTDGMKELVAKVHYVPDNANESVRLIMAEYTETENGDEIMTNIKILPFDVQGTVSKELSMQISESASRVSAFVWENGASLKPLCDSYTLYHDDVVSVYDLFATKKMRGAGFGLNKIYDSREMLTELLDAGCNTFYFSPGWDLTKDKEKFELACNEVENFVEETGAYVFIKTNFGDGSVVGNTEYGAYCQGTGSNLSLPCPLSEKYWERQVLDNFLIVAKHPKISGVIIDMEMYTSSGTRYPGPCFCMECIEKFNQDKPGDDATTLLQADVNSRKNVVVQKGFYGEYSDWFSDKVKVIANNMREKLHSVNSDLILGYMPELEWLSGITEGLGTASQPVIVFNENEYKGSLSYTNSNLSIIRQKELPAVYATGLWPNETSAIKKENLASLISDASKYNIGYWMYGLGDLSEDERASFLTEIKKGNTMVDNTMGIK